MQRGCRGSCGAWTEGKLSPGCRGFWEEGLGDGQASHLLSLLTLGFPSLLGLLPTSVCVCCGVVPEPGETHSWLCESPQPPASCPAFTALQIT